MKVEVNSFRYHVEIAGEGDPLLLLHGFTGSGSDWLPFISEWGSDFKLIMVDLIGHGRSDHPEDVGNYGMEQTAEVLNRILEVLKIESVYVLGYSLGGRVALSFAMMFPERVKHLLLESSSPGLKTEQEQLTRNESDRHLADRIEEEGIAPFVDHWESIPLFQTQKEHLSVSEQKELHEKRLSNSGIGLANSLRGMGTGVQPSWWDNLSDFRIPTTLIVGGLDCKFYQIALDMTETLPNGELILVEEAGHNIHLEQPAEFAKIVLNVLHKRKDV